MITFLIYNNTTFATIKLTDFNKKTLNLGNLLKLELKTI